MVAHDSAKAKKISAKNLVKSKRKKPRKSRRNIRRRRSKARYYKTLQALRSDRKTNDLCSSVHLVQIRDMEAEWSECRVPMTLPTEIVEWQKQDQIAYWKAKAIGLEFENRMLKQHLRNVYAKTIEGFSQQQQQQEEEYYDEEEYQSEAEKLSGAAVDVQMEVTTKKSCDSSDTDRIPETVPKLPDLKNRAVEMEKIYGDKAQKILGMETAIQLNYERHWEKSNPAFWPNLPLRL